eukprot:330608-Pelagomonas_calceolata.AAC.1
MAHPLLVWMPAKMRNSSSGAYKSLITSPELSLTGFSILTSLFMLQLICSSRQVQLRNPFLSFPTGTGSSAQH